jgi:Lrp/AsnC family transcriptional regulator, regulator for asnA, asnC and gidA
MAKLDDLDMKILSSLHSDASVSVPKLSKDLGINLSVMYSRIKRLQKRGVIEKFTVLVNEEKLGMTASAIAGLNIDPKQREPILDQVMKVEGVRLIREVTGRFDIIVNLRGQSLDELHRAVYDVIGKIPGVMQAEVFMEVSRRSPPVTFRLLD